MELAAALLEVAPRVVVEGRGVVWVDARGLSPAGAHAAGERALRFARSLLERVWAWGDEAVRAGVARTPVAAEAAARVAAPGGVVAVGPGEDRAFLAPLPVTLLGPDAGLLALLEGVGIGTCGELAALTREAVEVRFGPDGGRLWHLARAEDPRRLFGPSPRERPHASLDFIDYVLTEPVRLVFTANALLGGLCEALAARGEHARRMTLALSLANGETWRRPVRPARPTASREVWLRLVRALLERLTVPDAIAGMSLRVEATEPAAVRQGDLFDRGFATAGAVEAAVARLIEARGPEIVAAPEVDAHPLVERRTRWVARGPEAVAGTGAGGAAGVDGAGVVEPRRDGGPDGGTDAAGAPPRLALQLLPEPRRIAVETELRRALVIPVRYRDRRTWQELVTAAGPDRVSGGPWDEPYAREYFRCVTAGGLLVWIFRDARRDAWYLHGWWD